MTVKKVTANGPMGIRSFPRNRFHFSTRTISLKTFPLIAKFIKNFNLLTIENFNFEGFSVL